MRLVLVGLFGLVVGGLLFSLVRAQTETPLPTITSVYATPEATPSTLVADVLAKDDGIRCDTIAQALPGGAATDDTNPRYTVCLDHGITAHSRCWLEADSVALNAIVFDCYTELRNPERVPIAMDWRSVTLTLNDGRTYPAVDVTGDPAGVSHDVGSFTVHGWDMLFAFPPDGRLPFMYTLHFQDEPDVTFVIDMLISLPSS